MSKLRDVNNRYELNLDNRQLVLIFMGFVVILILSFVMGALLGKSLTPISGGEGPALAMADKGSQLESKNPGPIIEQDIKDGEKTSAPETAAKNAISQREEKLEKELLKKELAEMKLEDPEVDAVKEPAPADKPAKTKERTPHKPELKSIEPKLDKQPAQEKTNRKKAEKQPEPAAIQETRPEPEVEKEPKPEPKAIKEIAPKLESAPAASPSNGSRTGAYTIQVAASQSKVEAEAKVNELKSKKFDAYLVEYQSGSGTWYRIRIGGYRDRDQASRALAVIKSQAPQYKDAYVTSR